MPEVIVPGRERVSFSKIPEVLPLPDLVGIQRESFDWLLTKGSARSSRRSRPSRTSPRRSSCRSAITSSGKQELRGGVQGQGHDLLRPAVRGGGVRQQGDRRDQGAGGLHGRLPHDDRQGTFIINGTERVVVSQLVRRPGVYFGKELGQDLRQGHLHGQGHPVAAAPGSSSRSTRSDIVGVRIDRKRTVRRRDDLGQVDVLVRGLVDRPVEVHAGTADEVDATTRSVPLMMKVPPVGRSSGSRRSRPPAP